jgi:voltage-gated potassium channel
VSEHKRVEGHRVEVDEARVDYMPSRGNAYQIFILVLTVLSLVVMAWLVSPWISPATEKLLNIYNNAICVVFLIDFASNMRGTTSKKGYFFTGRGWLDLLGSVPTFGIFKYAALLRLARLSRLARITRLLRGQNKREIVDDVLTHRGQYAVVVTALLTMIVLIFSSILVLQFESHAAPGAGANIQTGGQALWWSVVTITTVGYGDFFPVTTGGRITAVFVMVMGMGIIAAAASIMASVLITPTDDDEADEQPASSSLDVRAELVAVREELAALRRSLDAGGGPTP